MYRAILSTSALIVTEKYSAHCGSQTFFGPFFSQFENQVNNFHSPVAGDCDETRSSWMTQSLPSWVVLWGLMARVGARMIRIQYQFTYTS